MYLPFLPFKSVASFFLHCCYRNTHTRAQRTPKYAFYFSKLNITLKVADDEKIKMVLKWETGLEK